jgi:hypothetical protein
MKTKMSNKHTHKYKEDKNKKMFSYKDLKEKIEKKETVLIK